MIFISVEKVGSSFKGGAVPANRKAIDKAVAYYLNNGYKLVSVTKL
jgi:hypothetical protein